MKLGIRFLIVLIIIAMTSVCVSASDTTTKFKTGPFMGSVDLGMICNDLNISKPMQGERLSGESYTNYHLKMCGVSISLTRLDGATFNSTKTLGSSVADSLLLSGADKDTVVVYDRKIDSKPGAVGRGYVPKSDSILFVANFDVSPKTRGFIVIWDNETEMKSILKTIKVTEAA